MKPKAKRKLKWIVDAMTSTKGRTTYTIGKSKDGGWRAWANSPLMEWIVTQDTTKRQAIAACERHAREKGMR